MPLLTSIIAASRRRVDPDAADYFARIVAAGSTISAGNQAAVNSFVVGCKADGIWAAIKASCLLAGPDDLTGALVPLVGAAPTNNNFVAGDYNRVTGLVGNASNKSLNPKRNNNADPRDDFSMGVYITQSGVTTGRIVIGAGGGDAGTSNMGATAGSSRCRSATAFSPSASGFTGFFGISRNDSSTYQNRRLQSSTSVTQASQTPFNGPIFVFATGRLGGDFHSDPRLSFYHIGESLDLALLDARLTTYMASIS
jgi:hypothetical protein